MKYFECCLRRIIAFIIFIIISTLSWISITTEEKKNRTKYLMPDIEGDISWKKGNFKNVNKNVQISFLYGIKSYNLCIYLFVWLLYKQKAKIPNRLEIKENIIIELNHFTKICSGHIVWKIPSLVFLPSIILTCERSITSGLLFLHETCGLKSDQIS